MSMPHDEAPPSEDEDEAETDEGVNLDQMLKVFLLQALKEQQSPKPNAKKKKRILGLDVSDSDTGGSEDQGESFKGSKGAMAGERLRKSMRASPAAFVKRIEET